jgi:hypothetical protein
MQSLGLLGAGGMGYSPELDQQQNLQTASGLIQRPKAPPDKTTWLDSLSFGPAFAKARKAGLKEFNWRGQRYNTQLKEEVTNSGMDERGLGLLR